MNSRLEQMHKATLECTFCGSCRSVCPVYAKIGAAAAAASANTYLSKLAADD